MSGHRITKALAEALRPPVCQFVQERSDGLKVHCGQRSVAKVGGQWRCIVHLKAGANP